MRRSTMPSSIAGSMPIGLPEVMRSKAACQPASRGMRHRAARAGQQAQVHLRKTELQVAGCAAVVACERGLRAAAERRAVQRRDHRLAAGLEPRQHVGQQRLERRTVEFAHVGAGDEVPAGAQEHDRAHGGIRVERLDGGEECRAHRLRQRVDRRVVEGEDRDVAVAQDGVTCVHATRSIASAMPWPDADAHRAQRVPAAACAASWSVAVVASRAPLMPSGWPSAIAPPFGLTCARVVGQPELAQHGERLRGERLVQLDHVDSADARGRAGPAACATRAPGRCP